MLLLAVAVDEAVVATAGQRRRRILQRLRLVQISVHRRFLHGFVFVHE